MKNGVNIAAKIPVDDFVPTDIILKWRYCVGDAIVISGIIRDLHLAHPGKYRTGIVTACQDIFWHNPYIAASVGYGNHKPNGFRKAQIINVNLSTPQSIEDGSWYFARAFAQSICDQLHIEIPQTRPHGDLYLSDEESAIDPSAITGSSRYALLAASYKSECGVKKWPGSYWQKVADGLIRMGITPVQIGHKVEGQHIAWPLRGVVNLLGKTSLRQLMVLARGAVVSISAISMLQHVAAALRKQGGGLCPAICIAGGRESRFCAQGPATMMLSVVGGSLPCCNLRGCWKHDVDGKPKPENPADRNCLRPLKLDGHNFGECMTKITPELVIEAVQALV